MSLVPGCSPHGTFGCSQRDAMSIIVFVHVRLRAVTVGQGAYLHAMGPWCSHLVFVWRLETGGIGECFRAPIGAFPPLLALRALALPVSPLSLQLLPSFAIPFIPIHTHTRSSLQSLSLSLSLSHTLARPTPHTHPHAHPHTPSPHLSQEPY